MHLTVGVVDQGGELGDFAVGVIDRRTAFAGLTVGALGRVGGLVGVAGHFIDGAAHLLHGAAHVNGFVLLAAGAAAQFIGGLGQVLTGFTQAAGVAYHLADQLIEQDQKVIEAPGHIARAGAAVAQVDGVVMLGQVHRGLHQRLAFEGFGVGLAGQIDEDGAFQHHIERVQQHHRPTAAGQQEHPGTGLLQGEEAQVVHGNHRGGNDNRQPVAVIHQEGQQHENAEVHLQHAAGLVDLQGGHDHKGGADQAAQQAAGRNHHGQHLHARQGAATDQQRLAPGAVPGREAEGVGEHQPEHAEHDAVGFAVVGLKAVIGTAHKQILRARAHQWRSANSTAYDYSGQGAGCLICAVRRSGRLPVAEAAHRQGITGADRAAGAEGFEDRLDKTVV